MPPLLIAAIVVLSEGLSTAALFPVIHAYCAELGGSETWVGILFALVAGPKVFTNPTWGHVSDRVGRRPTLLIICVGTLTGSVLWALAPTLAWLAISRLVVGLFAAQAVVASALAADVSTPQRRAASMALLGIAFGLAVTIGPALGGVIGARVSYAAVGWLCASVQLVSLALVATMLRETRPPRAARGAVAAAPLVWRSGPIAALLAATLVMTAGYAQLFSAFGLYLEHAWGFGAEGAGYLFALLGFVAALAQGGVRALVARFDERGVALLGLSLLCLGLAGVPLTARFAAFLTALILVAAGQGLAIPCVTGLVSRAASAASQGAVMGYHQAATGLGRAVGFLLGGLLFHRLGPGAPFLSGATLVAASIPFLFVNRGAATHDDAEAEASIAQSE